MILKNFTFATLAMAAFFSTAAAKAEGNCVAPGRWMAPGGKELGGPAVVEAMAKRPVVLLGEAHPFVDHHRWQFQMIAAMHAQNPNMVLAFEAFPRYVQPVLDRWIEGGLSEQEFLRQAEWDKVWRWDPALYMPLFDFARLNRIPMIAMNVEMSFIRKVRTEGWDAAADEAARRGVSKPADPPRAYKESLVDVFSKHGQNPHGDEAKPGDAAPTAEEVAAAEQENSRQLNLFYGSQSTWDRVMAEAIAKARLGGGEPLVVGIVGEGHVQYGWGIPHQLADLGIPDSAVLLAWDQDRDCADLAPEGVGPIADAVFGLPQRHDPPETRRARLGVYIDSVDDGALVTRVVEDSVAEATGIKADDVITHAAGVALKGSADLVETVRRQAPGTWLPLTVRRGDQSLDLVAKFPTTFGGDE